LAGIEAIGITDHDTFEGYDAAVGAARREGLPLIRGIELSTRHDSKSIHLLGYFLRGEPAPEFTAWILHMQESRRDRNRRLITSLQRFGIDITLEEVEREGRSLAGRPHFAKVMVRKGYVPDTETAFREYLDESARAYVEREEAQLGDAIERVRNAGGIPSVAHPVRIFGNNYERVDALIRRMMDHGLMAVEAFHSDHKPKDVVHYTELARSLGLGITGGSDFHGAYKPKIKLGTGLAGNLAIPYQVLEDLMSST
jgi:predicted metal-dependent phosphoesterase TrpH